MIWRELTIDDMEHILNWRNNSMESLRTPQKLTLEQQNEYYEKEICNRRSTTKYWMFNMDDNRIGYGGIENIIWEYRIGEISLIINQEYRGRGYGTKIVQQIIANAYNLLNLKTIWGEVYECGAVNFWEKVLRPYLPYYTRLPNRKYYNGKYYDSVYFSIDQENNG